MAGTGSHRWSRPQFTWAAISGNVLDRGFEAPAPNRKWVADFTYIWTGEGRLYVAAVIDLFSRRWSVDR